MDEVSNGLYRWLKQNQLFPEALRLNSDHPPNLSLLGTFVVSTEHCTFWWAKCAFMCWELSGLCQTLVFLVTCGHWPVKSDGIGLCTLWSMQWKHWIKSGAELVQLLQEGALGVNQTPSERSRTRSPRVGDRRWTNNLKDNVKINSCC